MSKSLTMSFLNDSGKKVSFKISNIKDTLDSDAVSTVMKGIIAKNIFTSSGGSLKSIASASILDSNSEDLNIKG